jgi:glycosyltransferase involved in cell wall biosynthesis
MAACSATVVIVTDLANSSLAGGQVQPLQCSYVLDVVIPVYNEERELAASVRRLHHFLATEVPYAARITVVDNASTDGTLGVAQGVAEELPHVKVLHLDAKGRGGALHAA